MPTTNSHQPSTSATSNLFDTPPSDSRNNNALIASLKVSGWKRVMRNRSALHRRCVKMEKQIKIWQEVQKNTKSATIGWILKLTGYRKLWLQGQKQTIIWRDHEVHQVNWYRSDSILKFHHISCVDCRNTIAKCCKHFEIGKM